MLIHSQKPARNPRFFCGATVTNPLRRPPTGPALPGLRGTLGAPPPRAAPSASAASRRRCWPCPLAGRRRRRRGPLRGSGAGRQCRQRRKPEGGECTEVHESAGCADFKKNIYYFGFIVDFMEWNCTLWCGKHKRNIALLAVLVSSNSKVKSNIKTCQ